MDLELLKEKDMKLLSRKRASLMLTNEGATPSRLELLKAVAKKFNTNDDLIVIKHIYPQFGRKKTKVIAHIYDDKHKMDIFEHKNLLAKHKPKQAEAPKQ